RAATAPEHLAVDAPARVAAGEAFDAVVRMEAGGRVQGLSADLGWDPAIAEPVAVAGTGWVESQRGVVWSARPGTFDAVLPGARGTYRFSWAGNDGGHRAAAPGIYFAQLVTGGRRFSRTLVQLP